jgi:hypothetical protein
VLLSSHLLHELEVIADDLIVIGNGRIVAHGTKQELLATAGTVVTTRHPGTLQTALGNAGLDHSHTASAHQPSGGRDDVPVTLRVDAEPETVGHVAQQAGVALMELTRRQHRTGRDVPPAHRRELTRRNPPMTTTLATTRTRNNGPSHPRRPNSLHTRSKRIPMTRLIAVELRKSFDTRSRLALLAGIAASAVLTTTAVIAFAPHQEFTYSQFTRAIGFPMSIVLPIIAVLSVTAEWSQRSGLTTFWLVPHRGRVLLAKASAVVLVAVAATPVAFGVGALGNLLGTVDTGAPAVWNVQPVDVAEFALVVP